MLLRVIDIETTGLSPPAEIIEIGRVDLVNEGEQIQIQRPMSRLYKPLRGIPPETKAVHHLTEADFDEQTPVCTEDRLRLAVWAGGKPDVLVAHNCAFERLFIGNQITMGLPWICTFKVALRVWPDAPRHTNQVLRYWRSLILDRDLAMPPHRAAPDAWVTAHLFVELAKYASIPDMISWTEQAADYPTIPLGRYRGKRWPDIPTDYLLWLAREAAIEPDVKFCVERELRRRQPR